MSILAFETHLGKLPLGVNKMCEWEGEGHLLPFYINTLVIKLYMKLVIIHNGVHCFDNLLKFDL